MTQLAINHRHFITDLSIKINSNGETTLELDSHTDTCVLGQDALIFFHYDRTAIVEGYDPALDNKTYATISKGLAYDDPQTVEEYYLVINQAIHIPHLDHNILCSIQCQVNDLTIKNTPKFLARDSTDHTHALTLTDPNNTAQMVILPHLMRCDFVT